VFAPMRRGLIKLSDAARPSVIMGIMLLRWAAGEGETKGDCHVV